MTFNTEFSLGSCLSVTEILFISVQRVFRQHFNVPRHRLWSLIADEYNVEWQPFQQLYLFSSAFMLDPWHCSSFGLTCQESCIEILWFFYLHCFFHSGSLFQVFMPPDNGSMTWIIVGGWLYKQWHSRAFLHSSDCSRWWECERITSSESSPLQLWVLTSLVCLWLCVFEGGSLWNERIIRTSLIKDLKEVIYMKTAAVGL